MSLGRKLPVVGDMCMGSALHSNGTPHPAAANVDGKAIDRLTEDKHHKYPNLVASDRVHCVVLACKEGGRWVLLMNAHLYVSWMDTLEKEVEDIDPQKAVICTRQGSKQNWLNRRFLNKDHRNCQNWPFWCWRIYWS